jgi:hypothetical protein
VSARDPANVATPGGLHFDLTGGTYYTGLATTGDIKISDTVNFGAYGLATDEITAQSIYTLGGAGTIIGRSRIRVTGDLIVSAPLTINNSGGLTLVGDENIIADGQSLIVGEYGRVAVGTGLALLPGVYTAGGQVTIDATTNSIITTGDPLAATPGPEAGDGLTIGTALGNTANVITLTAVAGSAATFTATASTGSTPVKVVELSGTGITIPNDTTAGASFEVTGTSNVGAITVKGSAQITLKAGTNPGELILNDDAVIASEATNGSYPADSGDTDFTGAGRVFDRQAAVATQILAVADGSTNVTLTANSAASDGLFTNATLKR